MILGLTGGFGCGKSTVLDIFRESGWTVLNTDSLCHEIYEEGKAEIISELQDRWGEDIFSESGKIDRKKIAHIVFSDYDELRWLTSLLYPEVKEKTEKIIDQHRNDKLIIEVPLLFEAGWENMFDYIIAVWTNPEIQKKRLLEKGFDIEQIKLRNQNQMACDLKLEKADYGLLNNGSKEELRKQCIKLINTLKE
jgi:dephospho-CoA kinase